VGFINFLKSNANANILSTPQLLALDAQEALIEVGDKVVTGSTATGGANGAATVVTPTFEDATIQMKIKPFISPTTNSVRLELKSNIKQLSIAKTPEAFLNTTQPLATRRLETNIVVRNGDTAVLGGLMKEDDVENITKVPLLGDIPIIGWLFKSRSSSKEKTNMLIFLTPKIVRTATDSNELLSQKLDQRQKYIQSIGGRDPYGEAVDEIQKRRAASPNDGENRR
jgi:general secretion pathway protein D